MEVYTISYCAEPVSGKYSCDQLRSDEKDVKKPENENLSWELLEGNISEVSHKDGDHASNTDSRNESVRLHLRKGTEDFEIARKR